VRLFFSILFFYLFFLCRSKPKKSGENLTFFPLKPNQPGASWDAVEASAKLDQWFPFTLFSGLFVATLVGYVLLGVSDDGLD